VKILFFLDFDKSTCGCVKIFPLGGVRGRRAPDVNWGPPDISETTIQLHTIRYGKVAVFGKKKLLYYMIQHESGRYIDFRQNNVCISGADYGSQLQDGFQSTCRRER